MELDKKLENKIKKEVLKYLKEGKPEWDIPHTLSSVYWIKELIKEEGGNKKILVTTMYFHDVGYPRMKKGYNWKDLLKAKKTHGITGAKIARKILKETGKFSSSEIKKISYLIKTHDNLDKVNTIEELLVKEADGLAQIDIDKTTPNLDKNSYKKFLEDFKNRRFPIFKTKSGKKFLEELWKRLNNYNK